MITIVDYGMGNVGSLLNMFRYIGVAARSESNPDRLMESSSIVLPGVGAFHAAMEKINNTPRLRDTLNFKALEEKVPVLGVCLGMQLLTSRSEEGCCDGLGWIDGETKLMPIVDDIKIPHMGWNFASINAPSPLFAGILSDSRYYFVHSYCVSVNNSKHSLTRSRYGIEFDSSIGRDNIFGVQFHPEKSHRYGMAVLKNFVELTK
ncbi:imidazole glycerol phosphate synthase subunit HisH [Pseudomonadales bacterium]|nr:imidazole glycerol phosphate synthase subunit HisH [Pseudomonadales bacterium]